MDHPSLASNKHPSVASLKDPSVASHQLFNNMAPIFSLTPGSAQPDTFIDYQSKTGSNLFQQATRELPVLFDGDSGSVSMFN